VEEDNYDTFRVTRHQAVKLSWFYMECLRSW